MCIHITSQFGFYPENNDTIVSPMKSQMVSCPYQFLCKCVYIHIEMITCIFKSRICIYLMTYFQLLILLAPTLIHCNSWNRLIPAHVLDERMVDDFSKWERLMISQGLILLAESQILQIRLYRQRGQGSIDMRTYI